MFRQTKRRTAGRRNFEQSGINSAEVTAKLANLYTSRLSFYELPPFEEITLEEFETWAIDRLEILVQIESCVARSKTIKEIESTIKPLLLKHLPSSPSTESNRDLVFQERRKDHYSHYILRLVFCRSEELRKKFVKNETILFKVRYNLLQPKEQREFVSSHSSELPWQYISGDEKANLFDYLYAASSHVIRSTLLIESGDSNLVITSEQLRQHVMTKENFIKLPFDKVPNLVSSRSVFLSKGFAYIPSALQLNLLAIEFQDILSRNLVRTFQALPRLEEDDRLLPLLNNLSQNFSNIEYESAFGSDPSLVSDINASSVTQSQIAKHYPMCASHLMKNLALNSHLKYQGRQQLGLFLKAVGLSVDEAMKFWSYQFTKGSSSITPEKFNKDYKYNIRHNYGLEGGRINYKPWDCGTILSKPKPGKGESHGCPYRDLPLESLVSNLNEMGITDQQDLNGVIDDVNHNDYTIACTRVFELTHKKSLEAGNNKANKEVMHINHPNLYFDRSRQLERLENKGQVSSIAGN